MPRNKAEIDWTRVDEMLEAGCTGEEIAATLGMSADTLYRRVESDHKVGFAFYRQQKIAKGDLTIREKLFSRAKKGDVAILIFLAKARLNMTETSKVVHDVTDALSSTIINIAFRAPDFEPQGQPAKG